MVQLIAKIKIPLLSALFLLGSISGLRAQYWSLTGNWLPAPTITNPPKWFGTINTQPIIIKTAGAERMRILGSGSGIGNIGINTPNPEERLEIANGILKLSGPTGAGGPMMFFKGALSSTYAADWSIEYAPAGTNNPNAGLNFWKPFGSPNWGNNYLFLRDNGNVGIGTNNPTATLSVNGNVLIGDASTQLPSAGMPLGYRLYVQYGILAEKVKVAVPNSSNWSDFVFANDYKLQDLCQVEKFIRTNKHLPDIPSASEVVRDGLDLGSMDALLLQKIEELTLYIIAQDKKIDLLAKELSGRHTSK